MPVVLVMVVMLMIAERTPFRGGECCASVHTTPAPRPVYECHLQSGVAVLVPHTLPRATKPGRPKGLPRYCPSAV